MVLGRHSQHYGNSNEEEVNKFQEEVKDAATKENQRKRELEMINDNTVTQQLGSKAT